MSDKLVREIMVPATDILMANSDVPVRSVSKDAETKRYVLVTRGRELLGATTARELRRAPNADDPIDELVPTLRAVGIVHPDTAIRAIRRKPREIRHLLWVVRENEDVLGAISPVRLLFAFGGGGMLQGDPDISQLCVCCQATPPLEQHCHPYNGADPNGAKPKDVCAKDGTIYVLRNPCP
jgi:hypothetical protein